MKLRGGVGVGIVLLALSAACAHADVVTTPGAVADVAFTSDAAAPDGALRASSQVAIQPHLAGGIEAKLLVSLQTGERADVTPVWSGVAPFSPFAWSNAGVAVNAAWTAGPGTRLQLEAGQELRTQIYSGPNSLSVRPSSLNNASGARLSATTPLATGLNLSLSGGAATDDGAVDLAQGAAALVRVPLRGDRSDLASELSWDVSPAFSLGVREKLESRALSWGQAGIADSSVSMEPKAIATLKPMTGAEWSLSFEHAASPLDPGKFVTLAETAQSADVPAAAGRLRPDETWNVKAGVKHRFRRTGAVALSYTQAQIRSATELVQISPGVQAPGSVSGGQRQQWDAAFDLPLDLVGLDGLSLQSSGFWRRSLVPDPMTGVMRPPSGETPYEARLGLTADLPARKLRLGVQSKATGPQSVYSLTRIDAVWTAPTVGAFVEYRPADLALRLQVDNLTGDDRRQVSTLYDLGRDTAPTAEIDRHITAGPGVMLTLRKAL